MNCEGTSSESVKIVKAWRRDFLFVSSPRTPIRQIIIS